VIRDNAQSGKDALIQVKNLKKYYKGDKIKALDDVSININRGDVMVVIGPSGSGKSTFLRSLNLLEVPTSGSIIFDGTDITNEKIDIDKFRLRMGMVFQHFNLFPHKTVLENLTIAPILVKKMDRSEAEKMAMEKLDRVGLADRAGTYPVQLSGGQKQRVGIARALATNPSILLCDEATSALDPETTEQILQLLRRINRELKITILFVTHQIQVIQQLCNKVAVMEHGRVVEQGSVLEVFSNPQQEITRQFVRTVIPDTIPERIQEDLKKDPRPFRLLKLRFLGRQASEGDISVLSEEIGLKTNIVFATVTELQQTALGIFILQCLDEGDKLARSEEYLTRKGILWKEVSLS